MHPDSKSPLAPMLRKLERWGSLEEAERQALLSLPCTVRSLNIGQYVVREGDVATHSCLLVAGFAYRQKIVVGGARQIVAVQMSGDMVDLQNSLLRIADHSVQALTPIEAAFIPRAAIVDIAVKYPKVGLAMWYDTLVDGSISREWIANIGRRDARTRIAHLLCEFGLRMEAAGLGEHRSFEMPMTQEQIADATGLTAVHVNRTLQSLGVEGLIVRDKRSVGVPSWRALANVADFNSDYLHMGNGAADRAVAAS